MFTRTTSKLIAFTQKFKNFKTVNFAIVSGDGEGLSTHFCTKEVKSDASTATQRNGEVVKETEARTEPQRRFAFGAAR